jgi:hypothetical protein
MLQRFYGTPSISFDRVEAESFTAQSGVQTENTTDVGGGLNVGYIESGDHVEYTVTPAAAGIYDLQLRVASNASGGLISLFANDALLGSATVTATGGWQNWVTISTTVELAAGTQTFRLNFSGNGGYLMNVNWMHFALQGSLPSNSSRSASSSSQPNRSSSSSSNSSATSSSSLSKTLVNTNFNDNNLNGWLGFASSGNGAGANFGVANGLANIWIATGGTNTYDVQFFKQGLSIKNGKTYTLVFDAKLSEGSSRNIDVKIEKAVSPWSFYGGTGYTLTTAMAHFTHTFTMTSSTDLDAKLTFQLGINTTDVILDNIVLTEK